MLGERRLSAPVIWRPPEEGEPGFYAPSLRASVQNAIKVSIEVLKSIRE
jgi:hypothetical protein